MSSSDRLEIRSIIKFCQQLGDTPTATYEKIQITKGKDSVSRSLVFSWHKRFKDGEESIEDREREGRKRKITATLVASIEQALQEDRRLTVRTLSDMFDISIGTIYTILREDLHMTKVFLLSLFYTKYLVNIFIF